MKASPEKKAVHVGRAGNVRVPVYRYAGGRFCVAWREAAQRKRETFSTKARAAARADEIALAISNGQADVLQLSSSDRDSYRLAVREAQGFGLPLHVAMQEWAAARRIIAGHSLLDAATYYHAERLAKVPVPPSSMIRDELFAQLQDGNLSEKYKRELKADLDDFTAAFPDLPSVSEEHIRTYLRKLTHVRTKKPVSARRRDNVRDALVRLMRFARGRGYLPEGKQTAAERVEHISHGGDITTYSPKVLATLLDHVRHPWRPWLAIAAFAGLRTSEIFRLQWSDVKWGHNVITVRRAVARKLRVARVVPMSENLVAWLKPWREAHGQLYERKSWAAIESEHSRVIAELKEATGVPWDNNALRHSFGSHRLALVKSIDQVALEMGNSPGTIRENYHDPKTEAEAREYFGIQPPEVRAENILPLPLIFNRGA